MRRQLLFVQDRRLRLAQFHTTTTPWAKKKSKKTVSNPIVPKDKVVAGTSEAVTSQIRPFDAQAQRQESTSSKIPKDPQNDTSKNTPKDTPKDDSAPVTSGTSSPSSPSPSTETPPNITSESPPQPMEQSTSSTPPISPPTDKDSTTPPAPPSFPTKEEDFNPLTDEQYQAFRRKQQVGPFSWKALGLFVITGIGLVVYFRHEKERMDRLRIAEENKSIGNPRVGGPYDLIDHDGNNVSQDTYAGAHTLVSFPIPFFRKLCLSTLGVDLLWFH